MDPLSEKIQYLHKDKGNKYTKFMVNIIAHLSASSRIVEKEIKNLNISGTDLAFVKIKYIRN